MHFPSNVPVTTGTISKFPIFVCVVDCIERKSEIRCCRICTPISVLSTHSFLISILCHREIQDRYLRHKVIALIEQLIISPG